MQQTRLRTYLDSTSSLFLLLLFFMIALSRFLGDLVLHQAASPTHASEIGYQGISETDTTLLGDELIIDSTRITDPLLRDAQVRPYLIRQLIAQGFTDFVATPYQRGQGTLTAENVGDHYTVLEPITAQDDLDRYLTSLEVPLSDQVVRIPAHIRLQRSQLYLFKTTSDLETIGYTVVSHRTRTNNDKDYRRFNISQAFRLLGNVRVIAAGETFDFMDAIQYDGRTSRSNYQMGYAIIEDEEQLDYGGGICGASTALYQGIATNTALDVELQRPHSKRYSNLYNATINGQLVTTPGIDSAIYDGMINFSFTNTSTYPIILVANYDGSYEGKEEIFTLSMPHDLGSIQFNQGGYIYSQIPTGSGDETQMRRGGCYTWTVNGEQKRSCYKEVF